jgi:Effector Associated Constant Component 1
VEDSEIMLSVSDQAQLSSLVTWLEQTKRVQVVRTPGTPGAGEQGALDVLTVLGSSQVLITAITILPDFIRAKRSDFTVTATLNGEKYSLNAKNVKDVTETMKRILNG